MSALKDIETALSQMSIALDAAERIATRPLSSFEVKPTEHRTVTPAKSSAAQQQQQRSVVSPSRLSVSPVPQQRRPSNHQQSVNDHDRHATHSPAAPQQHQRPQSPTTTTNKTTHPPLRSTVEEKQGKTKRTSPIPVPLTPPRSPTSSKKGSAVVDDNRGARSPAATRSPQRSKLSHAPPPPKKGMSHNSNAIGEQASNDDDKGGGDGGTLPVPNSPSGSSAFSISFESVVPQIDNALSSKTTTTTSTIAAAAVVVAADNQSKANDAAPSRTTIIIGEIAPQPPASTSTQFQRTGTNTNTIPSSVNSALQEENIIEAFYSMTATTTGPSSSISTSSKGAAAGTIKGRRPQVGGGGAKTTNSSNKVPQHKPSSRQDKPSSRTVEEEVKENDENSASDLHTREATSHPHMQGADKTTTQPFLAPFNAVEEGQEEILSQPIARSTNTVGPSTAAAATTASPQSNPPPVIGPRASSAERSSSLGRQGKKVVVDGVEREEDKRKKLIFKPLPTSSLLSVQVGSPPDSVATTTTTENISNAQDLVEKLNDPMNWKPVTAELLKRSAAWKVTLKATCSEQTQGGSESLAKGSETQNRSASWVNAQHAAVAGQRASSTRTPELTGVATSKPKAAGGGKVSGVKNSTVHGSSTVTQTLRRSPYRSYMAETTSTASKRTASPAGVFRPSSVPVSSPDPSTNAEDPTIKKDLPSSTEQRRAATSNGNSDIRQRAIHELTRGTRTSNLRLQQVHLLPSGELSSSFGTKGGTSAGSISSSSMAAAVAAIGGGSPSSVPASTISLLQRISEDLALLRAHTNNTAGMKDPAGAAAGSTLVLRRSSPPRVLRAQTNNPNTNGVQSEGGTAMLEKEDQIFHRLYEQGTKSHPAPHVIQKEKKVEKEVKEDERKRSASRKPCVTKPVQNLGRFSSPTEAFKHHHETASVANAPPPHKAELKREEDVGGSSNGCWTRLYTDAFHKAKSLEKQQENDPILVPPAVAVPKVSLGPPRVYLQHQLAQQQQKQQQQQLEQQQNNNHRGGSKSTTTTTITGAPFLAPGLAMGNTSLLELYGGGSSTVVDGGGGGGASRAERRKETQKKKMTKKGVPLHNNSHEKNDQVEGETLQHADPSHPPAIIPAGIRLFQSERDKQLEAQRQQRETEIAERLHLDGVDALAKVRKLKALHAARFVDAQASLLTTAADAQQFAMVPPPKQQSALHLLSHPTMSTDPTQGSTLFSSSSFHRPPPPFEPPPPTTAEAQLAATWGGGVVGGPSRLKRSAAGSDVSISHLLPHHPSTELRHVQSQGPSPPKRKVSPSNINNFYGRTNSNPTNNNQTTSSSSLLKHQQVLQPQGVVTITSAAALLGPTAAAAPAPAGGSKRLQPQQQSLTEKEQRASQKEELDHHHYHQPLHAEAPTREDVIAPQTSSTPTNGTPQLPQTVVIETNSQASNEAKASADPQHPSAADVMTAPTQTLEASQGSTLMQPPKGTTAASKQSVEEFLAAKAAKSKPTSSNKIANPSGNTSNNNVRKFSEDLEGSGLFLPDGDAQPVHRPPPQVKKLDFSLLKRR